MRPVLVAAAHSHRPALVVLGAQIPALTSLALIHRLFFGLAPYCQVLPLFQGDVSLIASCLPSFKGRVSYRQMPPLF